MQRLQFLPAFPGKLSFPDSYSLTKKIARINGFSPADNFSPLYPVINRAGFFFLHSFSFTYARTIKYLLSFSSLYPVFSFLFYDSLIFKTSSFEEIFQQHTLISFANAGKPIKKKDAPKRNPSSFLLYPFCFFIPAKPVMKSLIKNPRFVQAGVLKIKSIDYAKLPHPTKLPFRPLNDLKE